MTAQNNTHKDSPASALEQTPKKSLFVIGAPKPAPDMAKINAFGDQAGSAHTDPVIATKVAAQNVNQSSEASSFRNKAFLLRLLPEQYERIEEVFAVSNYKSKQKMGEQLLMEAVEMLAAKLGIDPKNKKAS